MYVPNQLFGISAIAFNMGDKLDLALSGSAVDLAFVLEENFFQDRSSLQAQIRSITES